MKLSPAARTALKWLAALSGFGLLFALLPGCKSPPSVAHITLPTTAPIRDDLRKAKDHANRSADLGNQEAAIAAVAFNAGIPAGSSQAQELSSLLAADALEKRGVQDQLTAALYHAGEMDRLQEQKQHELELLEKDDAEKTAAVAKQATVITKLAATIKKVERSRWIWRLLVALSLVADFFAGHLLEQYLRGAVAFAWRCIGVAYHLAAGALKAAFPLYTFWLPA